MLADLLCIAFGLLWAILFIRIILSFAEQFWRPPAFLGGAVDLIYAVTEPVLAPLRRFIPPVGGLDLSPLIVFFALRIAQAQVC